MEKQLYTCQFCKNEFIPTRRKAQKFCSATCRSKNHHHKNKKIITTKNEKLVEGSESEEKNKIEIEKMSVSGVGNAALGTLAGNAATALAKKMFISKENEPATKRDIQELKNLINTRYFLVHNLSNDSFGRFPYFDIKTSNIVYIV